MAGIVTLPSGSTIRLSGSGDKVLADSAVFNNAGTALFTGTGRLQAYGYTDIATWNNLAGSFFNVSSDGGIFGLTYYHSLVFNNLSGARFAKTAGTNSVLDSEVLNNLGDLGCDSGTLTYNTTVNLQPGGRFTGAGQHAIIGGTVAWIGTNTLTNTLVSFSGGTVTGSSNATVVTAGTSLFDWSGGTNAGTMNLPSGSTIRLSGSGGKVLADYAVFNNAGTALFTGTGRLLAYGQYAIATWNNLAGAFFNVASDGGIFGQINPNQILVFNNLAAARFAKTAGTNSTVDTTILNNSGDLGCTSGTLTYNTTVNLNPGGKFTGAGQHAIIGGTVAWVGTPVVTTTLLSFSDGTVTGTSNATVVTAGTSLFDWSGGTIASAMSLPNGSTIRLSGSGGKVLADSAIFNNA